MCIMGAVFFLLAEPMFRLYCPSPAQAGIVNTGVPVLRLVAFAMPAAASTFILTQALRGAGDTRMPLLFTWCGFFLVRIPCACYFSFTEIRVPLIGEMPGLGMGLLGAWLAMFADLMVRGAFFLHRFAGGRWRRIQV
jgi:Na+-driven multidrug efflux pump